MIQKQQRHPPGTFANCSSCNREPSHIESRGVAQGQSVDYRNPAWTAARHFIECCRCGRSTGRHIELAAAVDEWGTKFAQRELKLHVVAKRKAA